MVQINPIGCFFCPLKLSSKEVRDALKKKTEIWDMVPKGGRGSQPDPKFFQMLKWDIEGLEGGGPDGHVPNAAHRILLKIILITNIFISVVARYLFC